VVTLDAEQATIHRTGLVTTYCDGAALLDSDLDTTAGAAVAAGRFLPVQIGVRKGGLAVDAAGCLLVGAREGGNTCGADSESLEDVSAFHDVSSSAGLIFVRSIHSPERP
jgi:hypothetical protein